MSFPCTSCGYRDGYFTLNQQKKKNQKCHKCTKNYCSLCELPRHGQFSADTQKCCCKSCSVCNDRVFHRQGEELGVAILCAKCGSIPTRDGICMGCCLTCKCCGKRFMRDPNGPRIPHCSEKAHKEKAKRDKARRAMESAERAKADA
jgi:hypothetical protein